MIIYNSSFNNARKIAFESLISTIDICKKMDRCSEIEFRNTWFNKIKNSNLVLASGWYSPPPFGMAVLTGGTKFPSRISFDSLRNEKNWPGNECINWKENLLYCYSSPVNKADGIPGDIAVTLYFGKDEKTLNHYKNTYNATHELIRLLPTVNNSNELFKLSEKVFAKYRLKNCVVSKTDLLPLDLGHTFPDVLQRIEHELTQEELLLISKSRQFINNNSSWSFKNNLQFTIEPQLVSLDDATLPQISYHYLIMKKDNNFLVCNDIDDLIIKL